MTSADRRFAAISNVVRVRVEGSKKRLNTALPRSSGTFFTSRSVTPTNDFAVSRICHRIVGGQALERQQVVQLAVLVELRIRRVQATSGGAPVVAARRRAVRARRASARCPAPRGTSIARADELRARSAARVRRGRRAPRAGCSRAGRSRRARSSRRGSCARCRARRRRGSSGAPFDLERDVRALDVAVQADLAVVVAIERDVERAERES